MRSPMQLTRDRTERVPLTTVMGRGIAGAVVAGEACTEIGCEPQSSAPVSWIERLLGTSRVTSRTR